MGGCVCVCVCMYVFLYQLPCYCCLCLTDSVDLSQQSVSLSNFRLCIDRDKIGLLPVPLFFSKTLLNI